MLCEKNFMEISEIEINKIPKAKILNLKFV